MDIAPDFANVMRNGELVQVDPYEVTVGQEIVVKPGERLPLDGTVVEGSSRIDTSALTGESIPRTVKIGSDVVSGCINLSGVLTVKVSKPFGESTVQRILELVENASEKKARAERPGISGSELPLRFGYFRPTFVFWRYWRGKSFGYSYQRIKLSGDIGSGEYRCV